MLGACIDVVIVGAGISGLTAASELHARGFTVAVLETRDRIGGRCFATPEGADLGASWAWFPDEQHVDAAAKRLGLRWVPQRLDGGVRLPGANRAPGGGERLAPCGPGAVRMAGGYSALASALEATLPRGTVRLGAEVTAIERVAGGGVRVTGEAVEFSAAFAVVAIPPRVAAARVAFGPPLAAEQLAQMSATATWAGDWCKVVASFRTPFWRAAGDSGVAQMPRGGLLAVTWEAGGGEALGEAGSCIAGVNFGRAACARLDAYGPHADAATGRSGPELRAAVASELSAVFGAEAVGAQLLEVYHQAWVAQPLTWGGADGGGGGGGDPRSMYGHRLLRSPSGWGVHWAGTESERMSGHVEGAVAAGERVAREIVAAAAAAKGAGGGAK